MTDAEELAENGETENTDAASETRPISPRYAPRWKQHRNASLQGYEFPFQPYRLGQRNMMAAVYTAIRDKHNALIQAPTGIGKTLGTLFPALKAMGKGLCDKIFFLTARTTGKMVAIQACDIMRDTGAAISYVEIISKEKICFHTSAPKQCDECTYGLGYENRIDDALEAGCAEEALNRASIEAVAKSHRVCPFELSLDLSLKTDVIICDYNYAFDPSVYLKRYFDKEDTGDFVFLVDEGHNLIERGRSMFSAGITRGFIEGTRYCVKDAFPKEARALGRVVKVLSQLEKDALSLAEAQKPSELVHTDKDRNGTGFHRDDTTVLYGVPDSLNKALKSCIGTLGKWLENTDNVKYRFDFSELYYQFCLFYETADKFGPDYRLLIEPKDNDARWSLFCLDPSKYLKIQFEKCVSAIVFSATLFPMDYYREVLGLGTDSLQIVLPSPFPAENLKVLHAPIDTTYRNRQTSIPAVVNKIDLMIQTPGNYLVFFPSYRYMEEVYEQFVQTHHQYETFKQEAAMSEPERLEFIGRLQDKSFDDTAASTVGFAVLGGVFGEGIDLVGKRLVGVAIVGVGMPGIGARRDEIKDYYGGGFRGFQYAYTFPGMTKVLQAAGRVIRTAEDIGVVFLLDQRFMRNDYRRLLPPHWNVQSLG